MKYTGEELLEMWQNSKQMFGHKMTQRQLAKELGMNFNKLHGLIYRAQLAEGLVNNQDRIEMEDEYNTRTYTSKGRSIRTLNQLLDECEVDLDEWMVDRHVINKWDVTVREGITYENFQVKAWLIKRHPEPLRPVISSIFIDSEPIKLPRPKKAKSGRLITLADIHFGFKTEKGGLIPFHDRGALAISLAIIRDLRPSHIAIIGDTLDLAEWSDKFIRSPDMYGTTQPALIEASWFLSQLRGLNKSTPIYLLEGNHEERVRRAINKQVPYAYGLTQPVTGLPVLSIPNLLALNQLGIQWVGDYPKGELWITEDFRAIHGDKIRAKSGATATAILDNTQVNTVYGHAHRRELASRTVADFDGQRTITAFSPGCLCKIDGTVPGKGVPNWQQGIGVVDFDEGIVAATLIPIEKGVAMLGGKQYKGENYLARLKADTNYAF